MAIAIPVAKQVRIKKESAWGTAPGTTAAQLLRRVSSDLDLRKQTYQSNEIRTDYQISDMRHGVRSVEGKISGELSPLTYEMLMVGVCRKAWAATTAMTGLSLTIAGSGPTYTVTRSAGSFLTDGMKIGDVFRITAGTYANGVNRDNNFLVVNLTATVATIVTLNGTVPIAEGPIATSTVTVTGKRTYIPTTGHTDDSFAVEHWFSDIAQSELFLGCKINSLSVSLPATGMATIDVSFLGKDVTTATSAYYSSPTALTSSGVLAAVNGVLRYGTGSVANITAANFTIDGGMSANPVVGANTYPAVFPGMVRVSGQFSAFFQDATYRDAFLNETEFSVTFVLSTGSSNTADFLSFTLPRCKFSGTSKSDGGTGGITLTCPFTALIQTAGGAGTTSEASTIVIQDSLAP